MIWPLLALLPFIGDGLARGQPTPVLLLLMDNGTEADRDFYRSGNVLIDRLFNAEIRTFPHGGDAEAFWRSIEGEYRAAGMPCPRAGADAIRATAGLAAKASGDTG